MGKHVLYISYDGMTDPLGQSQVLPYIIGLTKEGYQFSLISFEKPDRFVEHEQTIRKICAENNISWHPQQYTKRPPVFSTAYDIRKLLRISGKIHRESPIDLLHCRSYISAFAGLKLKRSHGIPWLFDMRGFWADERVDGNIWNLSNPLFRFIYSYFKRKEKQYLTNSDAIVSLTSAGKKELLKWNVEGVTEEKITVIPCCVDLKLFNPTNISEAGRAELIEQLGLQGKEIIGYIGSIGTWYNLPEMMQTFAQLRAQNHNRMFLFVTREPAEIIFNEAKKHGISSECIRVTSCMHHEVPTYASLFDLSIFYIKPSYSKTASSPTKQGELMAMGIPIICNSGVGDTEEIVKTYSSGVVVNLLEISQLSASDYTLDAFNKEQSMLGAREYFGLENGISRYNLIYKRLIGAKI